MSETFHPAANSLAAGSDNKFIHLWQKPHHRGSRLFQPHSYRLGGMSKQKIKEQDNPIFPESACEGFFVKKAAVILHLHPFTPADLHLHTLTSSDLHLHTLTSADLHLHTLTSSDLHLHTFTSIDLHLHTFTPADLHLHTFTPADLHLHTLTSADLHLHTSSHSHIC